MTAHHTPGPWVTNGYTAVWTEDAAKMICLTGEPHVLSKPVDKREQYANAKLCSAAPDMLAALQRWQKFAHDNGMTDADYHDGNGAGWITMTDAAISKAKGA